MTHWQNDSSPFCLWWVSRCFTIVYVFCCCCHCFCIQSLLLKVCVLKVFEVVQVNTLLRGKIGAGGV